MSLGKSSEENNWTKVCVIMKCSADEVSPKDFLVKTFLNASPARSHFSIENNAIFIRYSFMFSLHHLSLKIVRFIGCPDNVHYPNRNGITTSHPTKPLGSMKSFIKPISLIK